jgi:hypothetical protein
MCGYYQEWSDFCSNNSVLEHPAALHGCDFYNFFRLRVASVGVHSSLLQIYTTYFGLIGHFQVYKFVLQGNCLLLQVLFIMQYWRPVSLPKFFIHVIRMYSIKTS